MTDHSLPEHLREDEGLVSAATGLSETEPTGVDDVLAMADAIIRKTAENWGVEQKPSSPSL